MTGVDEDFLGWFAKSECGEVERAARGWIPIAMMYMMRSKGGLGGSGGDAMLNNRHHTWCGKTPNAPR